VAIEEAKDVAIERERSKQRMVMGLEHHTSSQGSGLHLHKKASPQRRGQSQS
jgi:hypothetical protein